MNPESYIKSLIIIFSLFLSSILFCQKEKALTEMSLEELMAINVTTSSKHIQNISESPSTITVITAKEIKAFGYRTIWEALKTVVGSIPSDNGNNEIIGFRGIMEPAKYNSHVLWLLDGHTLNESYFQWFFPGLKAGIDIDNIKKIEIVRGPASVLYGSNAFTGVVNIVTKNGSDINGIEFSSRIGGVLTSAGGYNLVKGQDPVNYYSGRLAYGTTFQNGSELFLSGSYTDNAGQRMYIPYFSATRNGGIADGADFENAFYLFGKYDINDFHFMGQLMKSKNGRPLGDYDSDPDNKNNRTIFDRYFFEIKYDHLFESGLNAMFRLYHDKSDFEGDWSYDNNPNLDIQSNPSYFYGFEANLSYKWGSHFLLGGIEYQQHNASQTENYPSENNYYAKSEYRFFDYSFYIQDDFAIIDNVNLNLGFRYEVNQNYGGIFLGKGAIVYTPKPGTVFRLQFGNAFINPLLHDYFYHSSVLNKTNDEIVKLERERVSTLELVWENSFSRFKTEALVYYSRYEKFISITPDDYYDNLNGINSFGAEVSLKYLATNRFNGYLNIALQSAKDSRTDTQIYNSPGFSIKLGSVANFLENNNLSFALEAQIYGPADFRDSPKRPAVDIRQDTYLTANLNLNYELSNNIEFGIGIYNLFNTAFNYAVSKGELQPLYASGRNFTLRALLLF